ncbi:uncharacterized protein EHS24_004955 [Apiotrichum porosum]|uniref:Uncharacterized protein n=1 Tax=Apiotrichum porosum TaxID=105984 RepID=A0A427Y6J7_9TREE|nr:uncharacterized protein EHS24_004955 [Apiotrichum porosum]RSH86684.1 hypothetical protein EHS24_004955 [Apiotrichum porosum]
MSTTHLAGEPREQDDEQGNVAASSASPKQHQNATEDAVGDGGALLPRDPTIDHTGKSSKSTATIPTKRKASEQVDSRSDKDDWPDDDEEDEQEGQATQALQALHISHEEDDSDEGTAMSHASRSTRVLTAADGIDPLLLAMEGHAEAYARLELAGDILVSYGSPARAPFAVQKVSQTEAADAYLVFIDRRDTMRAAK